jgi:20S proteasome alpha/beta subunit
MRIHTPSFDQSTQSIDFAQDACFDRRPQRDGMSSFPLEAPKRDGSVMTVGIAVLCENAKTAVVIADRLVGSGSLGIDTNCVKLTNPAPNILAVFSGETHHAAIAIRKLGDLSTMKPESVAHKLRLSCARIVAHDADAKLRAYGMRLNSLQKENLAQPAVNVIVNNVADARMKGGFLLAANDAHQVRLYVVNDQSAGCHNDPGFAAVGSGSTFALPVLAAKRIHKGIDLERAIYAAYEAKRISEEVGTVGRLTDMAIVSVGQPARFLPKELIDQLEAMHQRRLVLAKSDKNAIRRLIGS